MGSKTTGMKNRSVAPSGEDKLSGENNKRGFAVLFSLVYAVCTFTGGIVHVPWGDEAQAWLLARDLTPLALLKQMHYEGSPALWHFILMPFAKTGFPYFTEFVLSWLIATSMVFLFLNYSPFSRLTKLLFIFSYFIFYEYVIIARNYGLSVLLLFLIATVYDRRFKRPFLFAFLVFLLFNTNAHSFGAAAALAAIFIFDGLTMMKNKIAVKTLFFASIIMALGGLAVYFQVRGPVIIPAAITKVKYGPLGAVYRAYKYAFLYNYWRLDHYNTIEAIFIGSLLLTTVLAISRRLQPLFFLLASYASISIIFAFVHHGEPRHYGFFLIFTVFALWISTKYGDAAVIGRTKKLLPDPRVTRGYCMALLNASLAVGIVFFSFYSLGYYKYKFSDSRDMAGYIKRHGLENRIIVAYTSFSGSALLPYLGRKSFWYPDFERYGTFITWNNTEKKFWTRCMTATDVLNRVERKFGRNRDVYLLLSGEIKIGDSARKRLRFVYRDGDKCIKSEEQYSLYEIRRPPEERPAAATFARARND
ncbi:MAG: hypothetical protein M0Z58_05645 [Nitrospiraceae bacterium]|nr:hypothetical protein [Nitrospiraceae bacterium]